MNITPDEQRALVQFFGTVHAQAKQTDQMIVGNSQFVKPVSPTIQHQLEQALRIPVQADQQFQHQQQYIEQPPIEVVQPTHAMQEPQDLHSSSVVAPTYEEVRPHPVSISTNDNVIEVLKEINLNLARIGDILEKQNDKPKRTKAPKSD
jgi:hypothetical protein